MTYTFDSNQDRAAVTHFLDDLTGAGIHFKDLKTEQSSLEDIFVSLVRQR
jgi:ABC-2 type transport system ATP-binding protein